jgi:hypothetical protein
VFLDEHRHRSGRRAAQCRQDSNKDKESGNVWAHGEKAGASVSGFFRRVNGGFGQPIE